MIKIFFIFVVMASLLWLALRQDKDRDEYKELEDWL